MNPGRSPNRPEQSQILTQGVALWGNWLKPSAQVVSIESRLMAQHRLSRGGARLLPGGMKKARSHCWAGPFREEASELGSLGFPLARLPECQANLLPVGKRDLAPEGGVAALRGALP